MRFYILRALCSQGGLGSLDSTWHFGTLAAFQSLGAGFPFLGYVFFICTVTVGSALRLVASGA